MDAFHVLSHTAVCSYERWCFACFPQVFDAMLAEMPDNEGGGASGDRGSSNPKVRSSLPPKASFLIPSVKLESSLSSSAPAAARGGTALAFLAAAAMTPAVLQSTFPAAAAPAPAAAPAAAAPAPSQPRGAPSFEAAAQTAVPPTVATAEKQEAVSLLLSLLG